MSDPQVVTFTNITHEKFNTEFVNQILKNNIFESVYSFSRHGIW